MGHITETNRLKHPGKCCEYQSGTFYAITNKLTAYKNTYCPRMCNLFIAEKQLV